MGINFKSLRKNKRIRRLRAWFSNLPSWVKFVLAVFLVSALTSFLSVVLYDRYYGTSPWSNRNRLYEEATEICTTAQNLSYTFVNWDEWPLESTYDLEGSYLVDVVDYLNSAGSYLDESGPSAEQVATALSWLEEIYSDYFAAQDRCNQLVEEYQENYVN